MAADGSVIIEISADDDELIKAFRKVSKSADELERDIQGVANNFREAAAAANKMDGDGLDDASRAADRLDDNLDDAAQAANRLDNSMEQAGSGASKLSGGFTVLKGAVAGLVADLAMRAVDAFVSLGREALNAADSMIRFASTMEFAGFDTATINASRDALEAYANQTVYDLETVLNTAAQLGANGVQNFVDLTKAAGNLTAAAGQGAAEYERVALALVQTVGAGKLTTENWNQIADAIPGASKALQDEMLKNGAYTGNFRDAMEQGQITAEEFCQAIMNLGMTEAAQEAATSTSTISGAIDALKSTIVEGLTGALTDGGGMEAITGFINGITTTLQNAGQYIGPAIDGIKSAISGIGDAFDKAFTSDQQAAILNFLKTLASALVGLPFQLVSAAVQAVSGAFQALITVVGVVVSAFEAIPEVVESVKTKFSELAEKVSTALSTALDSVVQWAGDLAAQALEAGSRFVSGVGSALSSIPESVRSWIQGAIDRVAEWGQEMRSKAESKMQEVKDGIKAKLKSLPGELKQIGRDIVQGLINGISEKIGALREKASELAGAVTSKVSGLLKINSPSKVMLQFGVWVSEGFANGITAGVKYVIRATKTVARVTTDQINKLNEEIEAIEAAAHKRKEEKELAEYKKNLAEKYDELGKAELKERAKIQEEIDKLEADWAEKQLQAQEKAQKEALQSRINALEDIQDAYQDAMDEVTRSRDSMEKKLSDFELFNNDDGDLYLWDIQKMIDQIQAYGDAMTALKDRGIAESLFQEIVAMDREEAILYAKKLLELGDEQYNAYVNLWEQKEAASEQVAKSLYQSEVDAIEKEYADKLPDALGKVADDAMGTFADRMATAGEAAVNTAKNIADRVLAELERVNAAQRLTAAVGMSTSSFSANLGSKAQNDAEARTVARRASAAETAMATTFMQTGKATRDVVLQVNGKEFARATLDDYRSVEDQSPRIVSD